MTNVLSKEKFRLTAYWRNRPLTAGEYLDFARELLQKLHQFDPDAFGCIYSYRDEDDDEETCYAEDFSDFNTRLLPQLKDPEIAYVNPDPNNKDLTLLSQDYFGFRMIFVGKRELGAREEVEITISAGATSPDSTSNIIIKFPPEGYPQFADKHYVQELFKLVVVHCEPEMAFVFSSKFRRTVAVQDSSRRYVARPVGWFTWIPDRDAKNYVPADIKTEEFANGTIITLCDAPPLSTDGDMVERARLVRDSLNTAGYLPPDPEADPDDINKLGYVINDGQT